MKEKIEYFVIIGDSLSDKGQMNDKNILSQFAGLKGYSPNGRFTNGFTWDDFFCDEIFRQNNAASELKISDDTRVTTSQSQNFTRTYCIGGLTAHAYAKDVRINPYFEVTDLLLSNLDEQRNKIKSNDEYRSISDQQKANTLVMEWSGANDLITVNARPTTQAAHDAVNARIKNLTEMIDMGYKHFVLFNLPNLSLTPRFQNGTSDAREHAYNSVMYFDRLLEEEIDRVKKLHEDCTIHLYDANQLFTHAFHNPEHYGLEEEKKCVPLISSKHYENTNNPLAAKGYMFWDEVHPTEAVHAILASDINKKCFEPHYNFHAPEETLVQQFKEAYGLKWEQDRRSVLGFFRRSRIHYRDEQLNLEAIMKHAMHEDGYRTLAVIQDLGWVNQKKQCTSKHAATIAALENVEALLSAQLAAT